MICWLLWGLYYQRARIYIPHGIPAGGSKLPLPRITIGGRHYKLGGSSGIGPWALQIGKQRWNYITNWWQQCHYKLAAAITQFMKLYIMQFYPISYYFQL